MQYKRIQKSQVRRTYRVRKRVQGTSERPRLNVYRSNRNISVQLIDDLNGVTLVSASTLQESIKAGLQSGSNTEAAKAVGLVVAKRAAEVGINTVRFDRGSYKYHGRVKALADAAREAGLVF